ncbi:HpcH/HpaI aldolase family protein [Afifella aestuarii]|uniref:HpcH/HpaI aldolase family protein n=1 Tax=Afifella aestuarii TaxID=1909496 RepID=UPI000FE327B6|nr:aldolase/citrate lyase family protein [Afifella aestuarii]
MKVNADFATRLKDGERLVGTFVKTPSPAVIEILGSVGLDFLVLDAEHAALGREAIDLCLLAARAARIPVVVRVPVASLEWTMTVLDCGAAGVMAPHVHSPEEATAIAAAMRFGQDGRGFSPSTPAAGYGQRSVAEHFELSARESVLICQIEDPDGAAAAAEIAAVPGVDGLFVGPVDLGIASGLEAGSDELRALCRKIVAVAIGDGARTGMFVGRAKEIPDWEGAGASFFLVKTDQGFLRAGAAAALAID